MIASFSRTPAARLGRLLLTLSALLITPTLLLAQTADDLPPVTRTYALENARIVQAPGRVIERGTVVLHDGLIIAVGTDVEIPFDAERIPGDSLVVYAGFLDGLSHAGIPKPKEEENQQRPDDPGNPPDDYAGIQPHRDARTLLKPDDKSVADLRAAGFGAALTVPHGRMLPGSGALILLTGDDPDAMVLRGDVALFAQFEGARGVYPATPMGVMAKMRQLYREAERRHLIQQRYDADPTGLERPPYDDVHYAFFPVLEGKKPILFYTDEALETYRALRLQRDLGFPLVLAGLEQSFDQIDLLKEAGVPLFFTLDLPKEPKKEAKAKQDSVEAAMAAQYDPTLRTATYRDLEAERRNLEARRQESRARYLKNAAMLHEAGLRFGFSTMDVKPADIHKNLRLMIEHGLPEDAALAALTTDAAALLGVSAMLGTVEPGKIANLVVTTKPYFDKDAKIKYVFVDGVKYEYDTKAKPKKNGEAANPAGTWSYTITSPMGEFDGTLTLEGTPGNLRGTLSSSQNPGALELRDVTLDGNELSFSFEAPGMPGTLTVVAVITGDAMEGTITVPGMGDAPFSATRTGGPDGRARP
ncbi:MAG: amidohydrolase [Rhodothermaceae bacterium]|nr:MAG: amidohydrolase [Rhodothermaceae bacterium]